MPLTPTETLALLDHLGLRPKRFLGQNFLVDGNIVRKSLELGEVRPGEAIVEIGPGLGTLTSALLEAGAEVWAVEKDRRLSEYLLATLPPRYPGRLHLAEGDAVQVPLADLPRERATAGFKIIANLPYAISTPWMDAVLSGPPPTRMVLMLQREAADRYAARAGTKVFGAISIFLQAAYDFAPGHRVAAACFHPRPEIDSCLLVLERRPAPFFFAPPVKALIRLGFQQRRKQIGSLLRTQLAEGPRAAWLAELSGAGLGPQARPEQIPVALWKKLRVT
jgi:16S rRNA (adenine1518-N6/adenine1519-N6)-dimethyltransferase